MRDRSTAPTKSPRDRAIERARREWQCEVVVIRNAIRAAGHHGELTSLDQYASGRRGKMTPAQLLEIATLLHIARIPFERAIQFMARLAAQITTVAYGRDVAAPATEHVPAA